MDKKIEKKKWSLKRIAYTSIIIILVVFVLYKCTLSDNRSTVGVEKNKIFYSVAEKKEFSDFINVSGVVAPISTIYLDLLDGGRIEEIYLEEGVHVNKGDKLFRMSNTDLHLNIMNREANLAEQMNNLRNTRLSMEQNKLALKQDIVEINHLINKQKRSFNQAKNLYEKSYISKEEYDSSKETYEYYLQKKDIIIESQKQDSIFRSVQISQLEESVDRMQANLNIIKQKLDNLIVKAPVSGELARLDGEIGEAKNQGQRVGWINVLDSYKILAEVDEHYISRIIRGLEGQFKFNNNTYGIKVKKVFSEVTNGKFSIEMVFTDEIPEKMRIGQTFHVKLQLSESKHALQIQRGGFYNSTGGNWVYVVSKDGTYAEKRNIKIGKMNPVAFEILEGLSINEKVIISSYDSFNNAEKLILKD